MSDMIRPDGLDAALDELVSAVAADPVGPPTVSPCPPGKRTSPSPFSLATDRVARYWVKSGKVDAGMIDLIAALEQADAAEYAEWVEEEDHEELPPELPENPDMRKERLAEYPGAADAAAGAVIIRFLELSAGAEST